LTLPSKINTIEKTRTIYLSFFLHPKTPKRVEKNNEIPYSFFLSTKVFEPRPKEKKRIDLQMKFHRTKYLK